jgi:hypothetical protein
VAATEVRPEQQRGPRGDERAERDDEDHERDRQRQDLGLLEVVLEGLGEGLVRARVAELLDTHGRVGVLRGRDGGLGLADAILGDVVLTGDLERDQRRAPVLGELAIVTGRERRLDVLDRLCALEAPDGVAHRRGECRVADPRSTLPLDEDLLGGLIGEAGVGDRLVGDARLAVAVVLLGDVLLADHAAQHGGDDDEGEPSEDGLLAVLRGSSVRRGRRGSMTALGGSPERR